MRSNRTRVISFPNRRASKTAPTAPTITPATTPREILRVLLTVLLAFSAMVLLPVGAAKLSLRGQMPDVTAWMRIGDAKTNISVYQVGSDATTSMPLNQYILEVLCADYTPTTPLQALEAAAVATRTYAVHAILLSTPPVAPTSVPPASATGVSTAAPITVGTSSVAASHHADVTDDSQLDLPLATEADVQAQYPHQAVPFLSKVQAAVEKTDGRVVTYQNQPILAFMFDISAGATRSSMLALGHNIPYLQRVACPDDSVDPARISTNTFTSSEVAQVFGDPSVDWRKLHATRSSDGFVNSVTDGTHTVSGPIFAAKLHLPSDNFKWTVVHHQLQITSDGRGTDLGMSLHEASILATKGQDWESILSHFYPDTKIQSDDRYRI